MFPRTYRLKKYTKCFIGDEAVTWMIANGIAANRRAAVLVGQRLIDARHVHHVVRVLSRRSTVPLQSVHEVSLELACGQWRLAHADPLLGRRSTSMHSRTRGCFTGFMSMRSDRLV